MITFNSWREAYKAQQSSRVDSSDPLWMVYQAIGSEVDEIETIAGTTDDEIVWLLAVEDKDTDTMTQYGVGKNQQWYSVKFDHTGFVTNLVEGSLKSFYQLPSLIMHDSRASLIYKHIDKLFEVYGFLANGKIEEEDEVSQAHLMNAERIKQYAKSQVENNQSLDENETDDEVDENDSDLDISTEYETSSFYNTDTDDTETTDTDTSDWLETDTDTDTSCCDEPYVDTDDNDWTETDVEVEVETEEGVPCCDYDDSPKVGRDESYEYKTDMFKFTISNERDGEKDNFVFEGTEEEAKLKFQELIDLGYKFVEQAKIQSVFVSFE